MQCKMLVHSGSNIVFLKLQIRKNALAMPLTSLKEGLCKECSSNGLISWVESWRILISRAYQLLHKVLHVSIA
nr:hypothetical protein [Tanacetum cinerariifolium]